MLLIALKLARGLEDAGFAHAQALKTAEVLSENMVGSVATKRGLQDVETGLKGKIGALEASIDGKFEAFKGELKLNRWMLALVIAATVIPLIRDVL